MHGAHDSKLESRISNICAILLLYAAFLLYPLFRLPHLGHLITWDEAMNICSVKALASLGNDDFSNWFWRHPPLYSTFTLLLSPMKEGFVTRIEIFNILLGTLNLFLLYKLNRRFFDKLTGSISAFLLAVTPGAIFFDMWIKRDHLAITFALLALNLILSRRLAFAALMAGLGFLAKETFIFLYIPIFLATLWNKDRQTSVIKRLLLITVIPALTSIWWFVLASSQGELSSIREHLEFAFTKGSAWKGGATFYLTVIYDLLGMPGIFILIAGLMTAIALAAHHKYRSLVWPVSPLLLSILFLSVIPRKVPWVIIVLTPCLATVQAIALAHGLESLRIHSRRSFTVLTACILFAALLCLPAFTHSHESMLEQITPDQYRGASRSREIARAASNLINDSDRVLLSSFHYWKGVVPGQMCPVFTCYFKKNPAILPVPHEAPFELIVQLISDHDLNWAIVSPEPGRHERDVIGGFIRDAGLKPANTGYACIFNTQELLDAAPPASGTVDKLPEPPE